MQAATRQSAPDCRAGILVESANPDRSIKNASDAIWWGFVTVTTVGYGDRLPVTDAGRVIGTILLFAGIALFSVLAGIIANAFLAPRSPIAGSSAPRRMRWRPTWRSSAGCWWSRRNGRR